MYAALRAFGTLTGYTLGSSNPNDVDPNTPEIELVNAQESSPYVSLAIYEGNDPTTITTPNLPTCQLQAYITTYDAGGSIPFVAIGGGYVHAGQSLNNPQSFVNGSTGQPYSAQDVLNQVDSQNGPAWLIAQPQAELMEAMIVKLNGGQGPTAVLSDPDVQSYLKQLS